MKRLAPLKSTAVKDQNAFVFWSFIFFALVELSNHFIILRENNKLKTCAVAVGKTLKHGGSM
jgi:hypothetical protein